MTATLSSVHLLVTLDSGNPAVYLVAPQHLPREHIPESRRWPIELGEQVAHGLAGKWYRPGGWEEITDTRIIQLLEGCPHA